MFIRVTNCCSLFKHLGIFFMNIKLYKSDVLSIYYEMKPLLL